MENELKEEWKEYNKYNVSNYGKVINKHGKLLKAEPSKDGYIHTSIRDYNGKDIRGLHRIVATVFILNPHNLPEVNHKDGVKTNNHVDNLEWVTKKENQQHACYELGKRVGKDCYYSSLTEEQVLEIYNLCKEGNMKYKDIAKIYNVVPSEISLIVGGKKWRNLNLEPLPKLVRGARGRSKQILWINKDKEYPSINKCYEDMKNTYGLIISNVMIRKICNGEIEDHKEQRFKWV